ncbi:hypothetical protein [Duganella qianjiadongensis]|uniref:Protein kinase domain-containing protein n=1 Tax=Duganella qianjiadongensis TaxID=2692176 RepID=A0ABW9VGX3_9BURK|nr:hypothetical protein [Duganella qianjiadongensis]MYM38735.1 hypothetical protein [Duganella qianjiadongensis]
MIETELRYFRHQLSQRASAGVIAAGSMRRLDQLLLRLGKLEGVATEEIVAQQHLIHTDVRKALSWQPIAQLQAQQAQGLKLGSDAPAGKAASSSGLAGGLREDYEKAIHLAQARQATIARWPLEFAATAAGSVERQQILRKIAVFMRQVPVAQRAALIATLQRDIPELASYLASATIARNVQLHAKTKEQALQAARENKQPLARLKHEATRQVYYYPVAANVRQRFPVAYAPQTPPKQTTQGGWKTMVGKDQHFVALQPRTLQGFGRGRDNADILPFETVSVDLVVSDRLMLAHNAGTDLATRIGAGQQVPVSAFKAALADLDAMHAKKIYLVDIKTANLTFDDHKVRFIDVDGRINWHPAKRQAFGYTPAWTTPKLHKAMHDNRRIAFQASDQYAMLLSMIRASSLLKSGELPQLRRDRWIAEYVRPEYRDHVRSLLSAPIRVVEQAEKQGQLLPGLATLLAI